MAMTMAGACPGPAASRIARELNYSKDLLRIGPGAHVTYDHWPGTVRPSTPTRTASVYSQTHSPPSSAAAFSAAALRPASWMRRERLISVSAGLVSSPGAAPSRGYSSSGKSDTAAVGVDW